MNEKAYKINMGVFLAEDRVRVFYQSWQVEKPKAILFISHGLGEHSGRYGNIVEALEGKGVSIYAPDHRGSGKSGGIRGHSDDFAKYYKDMKYVVEEAIKKENPGVPIFLLGHSLGGLIAAHYAMNYPEDLRGLILSAPALFSTIPLPAWKTFFGKIGAALKPRLTVSNEINANLLSTDPEVVKEYLQDPLVHDKVSTLFFQEYQKAAQQAADRASELSLPLLLVHGTDDKIISIKSSEHIYDNARSTDKQKAFFEGLYHETMNERPEERQKVLKTIVDWILKRT
jgi:acylglycerol lipase